VAFLAFSSEILFEFAHFLGNAKVQEGSYLPNPVDNFFQQNLKKILKKLKG
jgi:hypothetical protein